MRDLRYFLHNLIVALVRHEVVTLQTVLKTMSAVQFNLIRLTSESIDLTNKLHSDIAGAPFLFTFNAEVHISRVIINDVRFLSIRFKEGIIHLVYYLLLQLFCVIKSFTQDKLTTIVVSE